jgi:glycosyltransferase involved in cell wall biosynthesis
VLLKRVVLLPVSSQPQVSFLLPAYNGGRYLPETLRSLSAQTFRDFEIVAVNDGSKDNTASVLDVASRREPRLRVIHQENRGQAAAMNRGLSECRAPLIALIDADDVCLPERLQRQVGFMAEHPEVTALGSAVRFIDSRGWPIAIERNPLDHDGIEQLLLSGIGGAIIAPSAMLRRDAVVRVGGFAERFSMVQDLDIYLRLGEVGRLANLPDVLVCYRKHLEAANFARRERMVELVRAVLAETKTRRGCDLPAFALGEYHPGNAASYHREWSFLAVQNGFKLSALKHAVLAAAKSRGGREELRFLKYITGRLIGSDPANAMTGEAVERKAA